MSEETEKLERRHRELIDALDALESSVRSALDRYKSAAIVPRIPTDAKRELVQMYGILTKAVRRSSEVTR